MLDNKASDVACAIDNAVYSITGDREVKTTIDLSKYFRDKKCTEKNETTKKKQSFIEASDVTHYLTLGILGLLTWGLLWSTWGDGWRWDGPWFRITAVAIIAWGSGQALQALTTLPALLAALLVGILARNLHFLDMSDYSEIDSLLRKVYPVIILGKASLGWNVSYMKKEWRTVATLGVVPWTAEVAAVACCTHLLLSFPWLWGILLGSIYASVSCAVVMPSVIKQQQAGMRTRNWPQLVCTAGGIDTALSVGVYGLVYSYMFSNVNETYKIVKAALTLFAGVGLGVTWGSLAKFLPHRDDVYVTELRVLFVLVGGLFGNFLTLLIGWGGTGGVAVLACNATAAMHWAREGWTLNKNPAATAYRVIWSALEPMVFAYTGTYFEIDKSTGDTMLLGLGILVICLCVRLVATWLVCWDFTHREKLYICCTWVPKSIVEAVLGPLAINTLLQTGDDAQMQYAKNLLKLIVQLIIITTLAGYLLTEKLGPWLLAHKEKTDTENDPAVQRRKSINNGVQNEDTCKT